MTKCLLTSVLLRIYGEGVEGASGNLGNIY